MTVTITTFIIVMILMTSAGAMSIVRKKKTPQDYLIASRSVAPWLSALSTVATNNSGFMFIGMIAYTYRLGIESMWMMVGWIGGDLIAWLFVHPRLRHLSDRHEENTLPGLLGRGPGKPSRAITIAGGVITFLFLGVYAAAQLDAGSTALHALFGWDMWVGVVIGTVIVIIYSYAGGIRADIWTDAAQSFVMLVSMALIMIAGYMEIGGWSALMDNLEQQDPSLVEIFPDDLQLGIPLFILGFFFAGFGSIGQPHLMTRIMAIESVQAIRRARIYYFLWFVPFFLASVGVGLYARAVMPDLTQRPIAAGLEEPTELALPLITMELLPQFFVGFALAGLFAATVSTADSQIIVCSGAMTHDVKPKWRDSYLASKIGTFTVTALALLIALFAPEGVFVLVLIAWSALGASLGSVLIIRLLGWPLNAPTALTMMTTALIVVIAWQLAGLDDDIFKLFPAMAAAFIVYACARIPTALKKWFFRRICGF